MSQQDLDFKKEPPQVMMKRHATWPDKLQQGSSGCEDKCSLTLAREFWAVSKFSIFAVWVSEDGGSVRKSLTKSAACLCLCFVPCFYVKYGQICELVQQVMVGFCHLLLHSHWQAAPIYLKEFI